MKKIMAILAIVALLGSFGCCTKTASDGTVTKNIRNCLPVVAGKVCPTLETAKDAVEASTFLWPLISTNPKLYAAWLIFDNFSRGVCYLASQMDQALADFNQAVTVAQGQVALQSLKKGIVAPLVTAPALTSLRAAVAKAKK